MESEKLMPLCLPQNLRGPSIAFKPQNEIFEGYAEVAPLALALYRTAEAKHLRQVPVLRSVLDLGCGTGEFAHLALNDSVDVGIDLSFGRLSRCSRHLAHHHLCLGNACRMPFAGDVFQTVLAVSVLEHLHEPRRALSEVYRVLKPGGHLVGTAMLLDLHDQLFYPGLLCSLGSARLARWYVCLHDRLFAHRNLLTQQQWEKMFAASGLELIITRRIVSPRLTRCFDFLLAFAWPYRLLPSWVYSLVCRPPGVCSLVRKSLLPLCYSDENNGSSLLFVARKPEGMP